MPQTTAHPRLESFRYFDLMEDAKGSAILSHASDVLDGFNGVARRDDITLGEMLDVADRSFRDFQVPYLRFAFACVYHSLGAIEGRDAVQSIAAIGGRE